MITCPNGELAQKKVSRNAHSLGQQSRVLRSWALYIHLRSFELGLQFVLKELFLSCFEHQCTTVCPWLGENLLDLSI